MLDLTEKLSTDHLLDLQEIFMNADHDGGGSLDEKEFLEAFG